MERQTLRLFGILLLLVLSATIYAQEERRITGTVTSAGDNMPQYK